MKNNEKKIEKRKTELEIMFETIEKKGTEKRKKLKWRKKS